MIGLRRILFALFLFGTAFAYVEAAVVVYLRALYEPLHQRVHPGRAASDLFPLLTLSQLQSSGPEPRRWLAVELVRETATIVMLSAVALAAARNFRQWFAGFVIAFGIWDIFYYVFLKILLHWPESLLTWDLLFLLPVPWAGPVLSPVLVALTMIVAGIVVLWREAGGRPLRPGWLSWTAILAGGVILVLAFTWDWQNLVTGGQPRPFPWILFAAGEIMGLAGFLGAWLAVPAQKAADSLDKRVL